MNIIRYFIQFNLRFTFTLSSSSDYAHCLNSSAFGWSALATISFWHPGRSKNIQSQDCWQSWNTLGSALFRLYLRFCWSLIMICLMRLLGFHPNICRLLPNHWFCLMIWYGCSSRPRDSKMKVDQIWSFGMREEDCLRGSTLEELREFQ